jgi:hypothetical protein
MDPIILKKVKTLLMTCTADNCSSVKSKLMTILKPTEADLMYIHFLDIEPHFIKETCKIPASQVIPQFNDYFQSSNPVTYLYVDDYLET